MNPKSRENRLRRMAERRGMILTKCGRRDRGALGYGQWLLIKDPAGDGSELERRRASAAAASSIFAVGGGLSLDDVEERLTSFHAGSHGAQW